MQRWDDELLLLRTLSYSFLLMFGRCHFREDGSPTTCVVLELNALISGKPDPSPVVYERTLNLALVRDHSWKASSTVWTSCQR
jgi:hypothetical protein